jgi:4-hydroxymandelate oxidase
LGPLRQRAGVAAGDATALLAGEVAELAKGRSPVTLILGGGLPPEAFEASADRIRTAPAGRPVTGVWSELASELSASDRHTGGLVVVADHDALGYLSVATLDDW